MTTLLAATGVLLLLCCALGLWYLRGLTERLGGVERSQLAATHGLVALQTYTQARHDVEGRTAESIRRLEMIMAGAHSKGAAGEHILETALARLPAEWQVRDFRVGNKVVEFGLRLPNDLILPIDSKWPATGLLERLADCDDGATRLRLKAQIEAVVLQKGREVRKYIEPGLTAGFGVAAVPDAVYELCWEVQADLVRSNVALVSYSLFVPYLLLVFQTTLKTAQHIDLQALDAALHGAQDSVRLAQEELEGRFARAVIMLGNSRDDLSAHLRRVHRALAGLEGAPPAGQPAVHGVLEEPASRRGLASAALDARFD